MLHFEHHYHNCPEFKCLLSAKKLFYEKKGIGHCRLSVLPGWFFQEQDLAVGSRKGHYEVSCCPVATSGIPYQIQIDSITSKRQILVSAKVIADYIGSTRRPFLIVDTVPTPGVFQNHCPLGGYERFPHFRQFRGISDGRKRTADDCKSGEDWVNLFHGLKKGGRKSVCSASRIFFIQKSLKPMIEGIAAAKLPNNSRIIHIGGWKKWKNLKVSRSTFLEDR
jgi:hypothetical protein